MLKGIIEKLLKTNQPTAQQHAPTISQADVEAMIDAKLKEHAAALQPKEQEQPIQIQPGNDDDHKLTAKQIEYALSIIDKVKDEFDLVIPPTELTLKDLNRLIAYQRYKNKGTLINLVKKGVLKKK